MLYGYGFSHAGAQELLLAPVAQHGLDGQPFGGAVLADRGHARLDHLLVVLLEQILKGSLGPSRRPRCPIDGGSAPDSPSRPQRLGGGPWRRRRSATGPARCRPRSPWSHCSRQVRQPEPDLRHAASAGNANGGVNRRRTFIATSQIHGRPVPSTFFAVVAHSAYRPYRRRTHSTIIRNSLNLGDKGELWYSALAVGACWW